jgi:class 3 adenylate cyclase
METLAGLYRGEFMAGFSLPECPIFEEWLHIQREALHLRAIALLARLSDCHERMDAYAKALPFALRFLEMEPWNEDGLRRAMRLYALNGQREAALAQYETCCRALKRDLGVLPSEETFALAERIRCGELLSDRRRVTDDPPVKALPLPVTERRQITVLYCELTPVGVEDPDEALALLHAPQERCNEIIRSHSGHLMQVHGGGLLAYFGYPQASEHAARLAVQAALEVTRTVFPGIALRASIHTGMVISGGDQQVPDAIGATSGLAIHLRQLADYGGLVISSATQRLIAGYFECVNLGLHQMPGSAYPLEVFKVARESGATSRLEAAARLTPLVGRRAEIATLLAAWQDTRRGERRVVLLRGEAGIGKSRMVLALKEKLREQACVVRELRCFPEHGLTPFYPLIALYEFTLAFSPGDTPEAKFDKLADYVETHYPKTDPETVPLLAKMLALPLRAPYLEPASSPQQQREKTLVIVLNRLYALASGGKKTFQPQ